ncbi:MAG: putative ABC transport system permease protein [Roseivirga sp.]
MLFLLGSQHFTSHYQLPEKTQLIHYETNKLNLNNKVMFKNHVITAFRNLIRQKAYSLINIFGLSVGIMACVVIILYVRDESSYEKVYPEADKIYRVTSNYETSGNVQRIAITPTKITQVSLQDIPETEAATFIFDWRVGREFLVKYGDKNFREYKIYFADTSYFQIFQYEFLEGNAETALDEPETLVMTEASAIKYFGSAADAFGKILSANNSDFKVTGVVKQPIGNTSLAFDMVISMESIFGQINNDNWFPMNYYTYVKLANQDAADSYLTKLNDYVLKDFGDAMEADGFKLSYDIQPLTQMHFDVTKGADYPEKVSKQLLNSLVAIAGFILLIACINYINLSTAKSERRAKEVGIRKVLGAYRRQLILQFYGETFIVTFISVVLGVVMAEILMPFFNQMANTQLSIQLMGDTTLISFLVGFVIVVSLIAGTYPASFLSSFQPVKVLKGTFSVKGGNFFRRVLVTLQFVVSVFLIVGTLIIYYQLEFVQSKNIGYDQETVVYLKLPDTQTRKAYNSLKIGFDGITGVEHVTATNNEISNVLSGWGAVMDGLPPNTTISFRGMYGDKDFLETFGFELIAGESFKNKTDWETSVYYLINETGLEKLGLTTEEAIGKRFGIDESMMGTIAGVVKDFHFTSLHNEIEPWAVYTGPQNFKQLLYAKVNMSRIDQVMAQMETVWAGLIPARPFELGFVDDSVKALYEKDKQLAEIILTFTILAILIGCLGLFGLASYLAEKRTKEIGIRKVLGANVSRIVLLLSKEYFKVIIIANVIGWPIAYFVMNNWLQAFAYRIDLDWYYFALAGLSTVFVALVTVSYQSIKAAISNPIKALRSE